MYWTLNDLGRPRTIRGAMENCGSSCCEKRLLKRMHGSTQDDISGAGVIQREGRPIRCRGEVCLIGTKSGKSTRNRYPRSAVSIRDIGSRIYIILALLYLCASTYFWIVHFQEISWKWWGVEVNIERLWIDSSDKQKEKDIWSMQAQSAFWVNYIEWGYKVNPTHNVSFKPFNTM